MGMDDKTLLLSLGGPAKVARLLGYGKGGTNRVCNWMDRGIPSAVKVQFPEIFLKPAKRSGRRLGESAKKDAHA